MQLNEISGLVRTNIALTTQTLKSIRHEQWAELAGLATTIDHAIDEATEIGAITSSLWENVAGNDPSVRKQLDLYQRHVRDHIQKLSELVGQPRREYLEANAEAILFDAHALLHSLKAHTGFQALRAAQSRTEGTGDPQEAHLAEVITENAREEFDASLASINQLVEALTRELRIIAKLPGRATAPLTKKRRAAKASQLTCNQILAAIEPLSNALMPTTDELEIPAVVIAPDEHEIEQYLGILRWFMEDGENLRALAFPHQPSLRNPINSLSTTVLGKRVDASWGGLPAGTWAAVRDKAAISTFVAVTNRRIISTLPRALLRRGKINLEFPLSDVRYVRGPKEHGGSERTSIEVITKDVNILWIFPSMADDEQITALAALIAETEVVPHGEPAAIVDS